MSNRKVYLLRNAAGSLAAILENGRLDDLVIDIKGSLHDPMVGNVVWATVDRAAKGKGAWFAKSDFVASNLYVRSKKALKTGDTIPVQLGGYVEAHKARPASADYLFKRPYLIATPNRPGVNISRKIKNPDQLERIKSVVKAFDDSIGIIVRTQAVIATEFELKQSIDGLKASISMVHMKDGHNLIQNLDAVDFAQQNWNLSSEDSLLSFDETDIYPEIRAGYMPVDFSLLEDLWDAISEFNRFEIELEENGIMVVEQTRAFVAVDVDTKDDFSPAANMKANIHALSELPRQLRLRGLGGQIVIDLAPVAKKDRRFLEQRIQTIFAKDPVETRFVGWSALGHVELTRKRERCPNLDVNYEALAEIFKLD